MAMKVTLIERLDYPLFFGVITVSIDALLHTLWHFSYTLVIKISCHVAQVQGSVCTSRDLSHADLQAFLAPLLQLFQSKPKDDQNAVSHGPLHVYMNSLIHFWTFLSSIHCGPLTLHN